MPASPTYVAPRPGCPALYVGYRAPEVDIEFQLSTGFASPQTTAVSWQTGQPAFTPTPVEWRGTGGGVLLGGRSMPIRANVYYWDDPELEPSSSLDSVELTIRLPAEVTVAATVAGVGAQAWPDLELDGIPDIDATAQVELTVDWHDSCYSYTASIAMEARIDSRATVGDCALDRDAAFEQLQELLEQPLRFGSTDVALGARLATSRYADTAIIDPPYSILMFDRDRPSLAVAPAARVTIGATNPDLTLRLPDRATVVFYRRAAVIRHIEAGGATQGAPSASEVARSRLVRLTDGSFRTRAPVDPGRYVAAISFAYTSTCSTGVVVAGAGLDVVGP